MQWCWALRIGISISTGPSCISVVPLDAAAHRRIRSVAQKELHLDRKLLRGFIKQRTESIDLVNGNVARLEDYFDAFDVADLARRFLPPFTVYQREKSFDDICTISLTSIFQGSFANIGTELFRDIFWRILRLDRDRGHSTCKK